MRFGRSKGVSRLAKRYALVIDLRRCIGCTTCSVACKAENGITTTESWVTVGTVGKADFGLPGTAGYDTPSGQYPNVSMYYLPKSCMHCSDPPCVDACPTGASYKREDGIVMIDQEKCTGCGSCIPACPYDVRVSNAEKNLVEKCTLCAHRIDKGQDPFCVVCCVTKARLFGDINDPNSEVSKVIGEHGGYVLLPERGTGPSVHYVKSKVTKGYRWWLR